MLTAAVPRDTHTSALLGQKEGGTRLPHNPSLSPGYLPAHVSRPVTDFKTQQIISTGLHKSRQWPLT